MDVRATGSELLKRTSPFADRRGRMLIVREPVPSCDAVVAMKQVYVGHKPRPFALTLKSDLAVVERLEFRPVRNADNGCCPKFLGQEFHHMILADGIQR